MGNGYAQHTYNFEQLPGAQEKGVKAVQMRLSCTVTHAEAADAKKAGYFQVATDYRRQQGSPQADNMMDDPDPNHRGTFTPAPVANNLAKSAQPRRADSEAANSRPLAATPNEA